MAYWLRSVTPLPRSCQNVSADIGSVAGQLSISTRTSWLGRLRADLRSDSVATDKGVGQAERGREVLGLTFIEPAHATTSDIPEHLNRAAGTGDRVALRHQGHSVLSVKA